MKIRRPNRNRKTLRRYTRFSVLLDTLVNHRLTLVSPDHWEDTNDRLQLQKFKEFRKSRFVGALCLTGAAETFHHWKIFADGMDGICIEFDREQLERYVAPHSSVRMKRVKYVKVRDISDTSAYPISDIPFYKRWGFAAEEEVRIFCESNEAINYYAIPIGLECIQRVVMNPLLPEPLLNGVTKAIAQIKDCSSLKVTKSRLLESKIWRNGWAKRLRQP